jgi:predicted CoA-binding protein
MARIDRWLRGRGEVGKQRGQRALPAASSLRFAAEWGGWDSNPDRTDYESAALNQLSYRPGCAILGGMDDDVRDLLTATQTWAVVGCSPDPGRDSHRIAALLQARGKRVVPINPSAESILGERCYASIGEVPDSIEIDVVDVFRRSDQAGAHVDEAIARGARGVWLQLGVIDHEAADRARDAGLRVVMDRCPAIEWPRLRG